MFEGICYRFHNPRFSYNPYSGEGARKLGGRFNRVGVPALYLSLSPDAAFHEVTQGLSKFRPKLIVCYDVNFSRVVDLRDDGERSKVGVVLSDLDCDWEDEFDKGNDPASWVVADRLALAGYDGIIVPSFASGADAARHANLVAWVWEPHRSITHFDPENDLPVDDSSWPS